MVCSVSLAGMNFTGCEKKLTPHSSSISGMPHMAPARIFSENFNVSHTPVVSSMIAAAAMTLQSMGGRLSLNMIFAEFAGSVWAMYLRAAVLE